jgi:protein-arginine kinase activator protein McsA
MDRDYPHRLTQREQIETLAKIQRLEWLLKECIGLEEYELCTQIRNIIQNLHNQIENAQQP